MKIEINVKPFPIPDEVRLDAPYYCPEGVSSENVFVPGIPLENVPAETLSELCAEFRKNVFVKAGKIDPKTLKG